MKRTSEKGGEMHKSIDIHYFPCCCCDYQDSYFTTFYFGNIPLSSKNEKISCISRRSKKKVSHKNWFLHFVMVLSGKDFFLLLFAVCRCEQLLLDYSNKYWETCKRRKAFLYLFVWTACIHIIEKSFCRTKSIEYHTKSNSENWKRDPDRNFRLTRFGETNSFDRFCIMKWNVCRSFELN